MADVVTRRQALSALVPDPGARALLERWLDLVWTWNRKLDLTAAKTEEDLVELGVLDGVEVAALVSPAPAGARQARAIDVGSGFGAPGMALAILRPDLHVVLAEPLGKRAAFLRTVVGSLGLVDRVEVVAKKGQELVTAAPYDVAVSRATLAPPEWLDLGDRLAPGGEVIVLLAREDAPVHPRRAPVRERSYATRSGAPRRAVSFGVAAPDR